MPAKIFEALLKDFGILGLTFGAFQGICKHCNMAKVFQGLNYFDRSQIVSLHGFVAYDKMQLFIHKSAPQPELGLRIKMHPRLYPMSMDSIAIH